MVPSEGTLGMHPIDITVTRESMKTYCEEFAAYNGLQTEQVERQDQGPEGERRGSDPAAACGVG